MKHLITALLLLFSLQIFSQQQDLKIEKGRFYINDEVTSLNNFVNAMQSNEEAYKLALKGKSGYSTGNVLGFIGGFMIGWPIGTAIGGGDPNWAIAGGGAAVLVIAIPVMSSASKKLKEAVDIYEGSSNAQARKLDLKVMPNQIGFVYSF
ncbi:hypothetical protein [Ekhidna sp.]|uniref:hypothetical protein n=1 Tax=Ekhidna sp. TaxID=2608089 RepID=UPI003514EF10